MRYVIVSIVGGDVVGTNDEGLAKETAECEDFFVVDVVTLTWLLSDGTRKPIPEVK
jgi:hypothetical protein